MILNSLAQVWGLKRLFVERLNLEMRNAGRMSGPGRHSRGKIGLEWFEITRWVSYSMTVEAFRIHRQAWPTAHLSADAAPTKADAPPGPDCAAAGED